MKMLKLAMRIMAMILMFFIGFDVYLMYVQPIENPTWDFLALVPMATCALACADYGTE